MHSRMYLFAAFLVLPAWSQEPHAKPPEPAVSAFDLRSDAVKKIVHDTAASQYASVREANKVPEKSETEAFVYVPPEKASAPASEPPPLPPAPAPRPTASCLKCWIR
jgi:hypothetical protein